MVRLLHAPRSERVPLREIYRVSNTAGSSDEPGDDEDDVSPSATAAPARRPVRIEPKNASAETTLAEPVFEPVRKVAIGQSSAEPAPPVSITKGFQYEHSRSVTITPEELRSIVPPTSIHMEIMEFVRLAEIDPVILKHPTI